MLILCSLLACRRLQAADVVNTPQQIKNFITRMKAQLEKNEDSFPQLISQAEQMATTSTNPTTAAVLHSMVAEMYSDYYTQRRWQIQQRTPIVGYVPADMQVWTGNIFADTIQWHVSKSLADAPLLQKTDVSSYNTILTPGKDSPALRPTLFDFLSYRGISILEQTNWQHKDNSLKNDVKNIYLNLIAFRKSADNPKALLLVELDYLQFLYADTHIASNRKKYMEALDDLDRQYGSQPFSVEIAIARINLYESMPYNAQNPDSIQGVIYNYAKKVIAQYPQYPRTARLKNKIKLLTEPFVNVESMQTAYPGEGIKLRIHYRNVPAASVTLYTSTLSPDRYYYSYNFNDTRKKIPFGTKLETVSIKLPVPEPYTSQDTTVVVPADKLGLYEYVVSTNGKTPDVRKLVSVSRLYSAYRPRGEEDEEISLTDQADILVTDYKSGKPVEGAEVILYKNSRTGSGNQSVQVRTARTDRDGLVTVSTSEKVNAYRVVHGEDKYITLSQLYGGWIQAQGDNKPQVSLFTDRGLYRPGQTIFFKGIAYSSDPNNPHVVTDITYTVSLRDANNQEVASKKFTTNDYGSFNGSFTLPQQTLNGSFRLETQGGSASFQVEEYKRPTFLVNFLPIKKEITFGDNVYLQGTARTFSGANLDGSEVQYTIVRRPLWPRSSMFAAPEQVANGKATVGKNGVFTFSFVPEKEEGDLPESYYRYEATAVVTNSIGESQEGHYFFSVGDRSMNLSIDIPYKYDKDANKKIVIFATNLNNQQVAASGKYTLYLLEDTKSLEPEADQSTSNRAIKEQVYQGNFIADAPIDTRDFARFPSGRYRIKMEAMDSQNRPVTSEHEFILYSRKDKRPPIYTPLWIVGPDSTIVPGTTADLLFGTSLDKAYVLYEIINNGEVLKRERIELNNENRTFRIPYTADFGDGVSVSFTYVQDGKLYFTNQALLKRFPDRNLTITPRTFRDKLRPGQEESWSFRITDADSVPALAEMLAGMYDASLDQIAPFEWNFFPVRSYYPQQYFFNEGQAYQSTRGYASARTNLLKVPLYDFDRLNMELPYYSNTLYSRRAGRAQGVMIAEDSAPVLAESVVEVRGYASRKTKSETGAIPAPQQPATNAENASGEAPLQLRKNFNETAFFYPNLMTNKEGEVLLNFTLPESNTTWKFMSVAYTKDLKYGKLTREVVSQKELMVVPNLPRFMRRGDQVTLSTQILNLSDKALSGTVRLEFFNPTNEQNVASLTMPARSFSVAAGEVGQAFWEINVPADLDLLGCRIIAETPQASDGEQNLLPILPDELLITESKPFILTTPGSKTIQTGWSATSSTMRPVSMTLEVTGNPIWYAVQALPTVTTPEDDDAVSWFSAYYTNTLAEYIARTQPKVQAMISQWEKQGGTSETLYSNLQKNQELKNILLEETPWVLAAKNETEQKQQLSLLFNINHANQLKRQALAKILELQTAEGGWSWYPGMPVSRPITLYILKGMAQLTHLGATEYGEQEKTMQINALNALDKDVSEEYDRLKKNNPNGIKMNNLSSDLIEYLFVRSAYRDIPPYGNSRAAVRFYTGVAQKNWLKQSLYDRALIAQLMFRDGNKTVAKSIIDALRETAIESPELGMYWANNKRFSHFFLSPISVHCQLMDAFEEIAPDKQEINAMKQWLLVQKQTQNWESVPATVNAIYALLSTGSDWLTDNGNCIVTWGNRHLETSSGEAGTGYIQQTVSGSEITPNMQNVTIQKTGDSPAWGAVYRQYFEKVSRVKASEGSLSVEKKLFVVSNSGQGAELLPITPDRPLKVGDRVTVRLIISTDREMDYVALKDMRAGCFEPVNQLSGTQMRDGLIYYQSPKDASQNYFFNRLPRGTYVIEYPVYVTRAGRYSGGISTIQCLYAPEFVSHTEGTEVVVK